MSKKYTEWYRNHFTVQSEYYLKFATRTLQEHSQLQSLNGVANFCQSRKKKSSSQKHWQKNISYERPLFLNTEFQTSFVSLCILKSQLFQTISFLSRAHKMPHSNLDRNTFHSNVIHAFSQYMEKSVCILRHNRPRTILSISFQFSAFRSSHCSKLYSLICWQCYLKSQGTWRIKCHWFLGKKLIIGSVNHNYIFGIFFFVFQNIL
jgi:hypothetical protein